MAIARAGIVPIISGKLGSIEFAQTRTGLVIKKARPPRSLGSIRTYRAQSVWAHRSALWNALEPEEVTAWEKAAHIRPRTNRLGSTIYLSGRQLFMSNLLDTSQTTTTTDYTAVPLYRPPLITQFTATLYAGGPYTITLSYAIVVLFFLHEKLEVARFLPSLTTPKPRTWINIGTFKPLDDPYTWYERFTRNNVALIEGEHVALRAQLHGLTTWPGIPSTLYTTVLPAP